MEGLWLEYTFSVESYNIVADTLLLNMVPGSEGSKVLAEKNAIFSVIIHPQTQPQGLPSEWSIENTINTQRHRIPPGRETHTAATPPHRDVRFGGLAGVDYKYICVTCFSVRWNVKHGQGTKHY